MDAISYIMGMEDGYAAGANNIVIEGGDDYSFTDPGSDGNIVIEKEEG